MNDQNLWFIRDLFRLTDLLNKRCDLMVETLMISKEFDEALLGAVDFAFHSLGKSCQLALYFHLKTIFHIERAEIPSKIEQFDDGLNAIFRDGSVFLERLILEKLCEELGVEFEEKQAFDFVEAISKIRSMVLEESLLTASGFGEEVAMVKRRSGGGKLESES
jgi:hypothetical protein